MTSACNKSAVCKYIHIKLNCFGNNKQTNSFTISIIYKTKILKEFELTISFQKYIDLELNCVFLYH